MRGRRKRNKPSDWRFTLEQIARELGKLYPAREKLPPQLRALAKQLEHKVTARRHSHRARQQDRQNGLGDDGQGRVL